MARHRPICFPAARWLCGFAALIALLAATRPARGQYDPDWSRHFRIGTLVGFNIKAEFTLSGQFNIANSPGVYDDGYVHPGQNANGYTANWGYENPSQYDAATHSLFMHQTTSFSASGRAKRDDSPYVGADLAYGGNLWYVGRLRVGWDLGFGFLPIHITDNQMLSAQASQTTFKFDTGTIVVPAAPYHGTAGGVGPSIPATPTIVSNATFTSTIAGSRTLDVYLYAIRLGPSVYMDLNPHWGISASAGPAVGVVSGDYRFNETVQTGAGSAPHQGSIGMNDVLLGGYVSGAIMYHAQNNGDVYLGVQYMPLGAATASGAGRQARLDLNGEIFFSAGFNWPF